MFFLEQLLKFDLDLVFRFFQRIHSDFLYCGMQGGVKSFGPAVFFQFKHDEDPPYQRSVEMK